MLVATPATGSADTAMERERLRERERVVRVVLPAGLLVCIINVVVY